MDIKITRIEFICKSIFYGSMMLLPKFLMAQTARPLVSKFTDNSTAEEVTRGLDLAGKTILVTGANSGLGFETMRVLALRGAHVLAVARNMKKAKKAAFSVEGRVTPLVCELTDFKSITDCAKAVERLGLPLDALICNAGIMALPELQTVAGLEKQFVVNYLGHFLLAQRLLPQLKAAPQGRIVMLSSALIKDAPDEGIDFDNLSGKKSYAPFTAYGQSKLAMALFATEFSRRFSDGSVTANAVQPGVINTKLLRNMSWYKRWAASLLGWAFIFTKSVEEGAATQCYVATHPSLNKTSGHLFADCNVVNTKNRHLSNRKLSKRLWHVSMQLTKEYLKK